MSSQSASDGVTYRALRSGVLRCSVHNGLRAVAVCTTCGQGICRNCAVDLEGREYCRKDAEKLLRQSRVKRDPDQRSSFSIAASALSLAAGSVAAGIGFLYIVLGLVAPGIQSGQDGFSSPLAQSLAFFDPAFTFQSSLIMELGVVVFCAGMVSIAAGVSLWRSSKAASVVAAAVAVVYAVVGLVYFDVFAVVGLFVFVIIALALTDVGAVVVGWSRFR